MGQLIGDIHNPEVAVYVATEFREKTLEEHFELIKKPLLNMMLVHLKLKWAISTPGQKIFIIPESRKD